MFSAAIFFFLSSISEVHNVKKESIHNFALCKPNDFEQEWQKYFNQKFYPKTMQYIICL